MFELPHTLVGAAIAAKIHQPLLSIPLAFLSHFLVDLIPHWNPSLYQETKKYNLPTKKSTIFIVVDVVLSLTLGFFIAFRFWPQFSQAGNVVLSCFAAVLLDVIEGPYFFLNIRPPILTRLIEFQNHHQNQASLIPGLATQGLLIGLCLVVIFL